MAFFPVPGCLRSAASWSPTYMVRYYFCWFFCFFSSTFVTKPANCCSQNLAHPCQWVGYRFTWRRIKQHVLDLYTSNASFRVTELCQATPSSLYILLYYYRLLLSYILYYSWFIISLYLFFFIYFHLL